MCGNMCAVCLPSTIVVLRAFLGPECRRVKGMDGGDPGRCFFCLAFAVGCDHLPKQQKHTREEWANAALVLRYKCTNVGEGFEKRRWFVAVRQLLGAARNVVGYALECLLWSCLARVQLLHIEFVNFARFNGTVGYQLFPSLAFELQLQPSSHSNCRLFAPNACASPCKSSSCCSSKLV